MLHIKRHLTQNDSVCYRAYKFVKEMHPFLPACPRVYQFSWLSFCKCGCAYVCLCLSVYLCVCLWMHLSLFVCVSVSVSVPAFLFYSGQRPKAFYSFGSQAHACYSSHLSRMTVTRSAGIFAKMSPVMLLLFQLLGLSRIPFSHLFSSLLLLNVKPIPYQFYTEIYLRFSDSCYTAYT